MTLKNQANDGQQQIDLKFMKKAIALARKSELAGEIPIAALVVDKNGRIISQSTNLRETKTTVLGHAELVALHRACKKLGSWRLNGCTLYVTLEPCFMCAGALVQARIDRVVFATHDPKAGALGSVADLSNHEKLNHRFVTQQGPLQEESSQMLKNFFKKKRTQN
ncbi:MAG: nucleoside deaminase [Bdellovibrio sp.]|nr:nucleoside deaminase [Bdellovibrio sp.]